MSVFYHCDCSPRLLLLAMLLAVPALADDAAWDRKDLFVKPQDRGEKVLSTWRGGQWHEGDISGRYSFLLTRVPGAGNRLYVQWVVNEKGIENLAYSLSVRDLNRFAEYDISLPRCFDAQRCNVAHFEARHRFEDTYSDLTLTMGSLGHYRIGLE